MVHPELTEAREAAQTLLQRWASGWTRAGGLGTACAYAIESGGKRLRPTIGIALGRMLLHRSDALSSPTDEALVQAAAGVELLHIASLIADDLPCMDDDDERRGLPTVHCKYGEATALLASYALIAHGYEAMAMAARHAPCPLLAVEAVGRIARCGGLQGACEGQYLDLALAAGGKGDHHAMLQLKTGSLFEMAFLCGWGFGGASPVQAEQVQPLAEAFGLTFQYLDDLQDRQKDGKENTVRTWGAESVLKRACDELARFQAILGSLGWLLGPMRELSEWMESSLSSAAQTVAGSTSAAPMVRMAEAAGALRS
jgi:geranylgeranyl diphosphate synthase, type II